MAPAIHRKMDVYKFHLEFVNIHFWIHSHSLVIVMQTSELGGVQFEFKAKDVCLLWKKLVQDFAVSKETFV